MRAIVIHVTNDEVLLISRAAEVAGATVKQFILSAAIEEADGLAHMHTEGAEGFERPAED